MEPTFFSTQAAFRTWLKKNHAKETALLVGFYKVDSGIPSMSWSESVDQALCFGWIDGVRKSINDKSYTIRFTPRKPTSIWSAINIAKVEQLTAQGLMQPAGLAAFELRTSQRSKIYSHENEPAKLSGELLKKFKSNRKAWKFFTAQAPSYQKVITHWIVTAKQEVTRFKRLDRAITASEQQQRIE